MPTKDKQAEVDGKTLEEKARALNWLNERFGLSCDDLVGEAVTIMCSRTEEGNLSAYLLDKEGKEWRISEVLAAFAQQAIEEEREGCAWEAYPGNGCCSCGNGELGKIIAAAIRARGEKANG